MSASDVERLLPCPFCGGEAYLTDRTIDDPDTEEYTPWFEVGCSACEAVRFGGNPETCPIHDWNTRALSPHPDPIPASADIAGRLAKALEAMLCMMDYGSKPQKFDAALTWRQNDEKARALAEAALAAYRANPSGDSLRARIAELEKQTERDGMTIRKLQTCKQIAERNQSGWIPVGERLPDYVIIGHGESYDTKFATEETLLDVLAGLIYYDPKEMPDEERAEWAARLADDDEWMSDPDIGRTKFTCGLGETDHIEIFRIVKPLPPPPQEGHSGRIYTAPEEVEAAQQHMREGKA